MVLSLIKGLKPPLLLVFSFSKHSALHARFWRGCIVCGKNSKFYWLVVRPCPAFFSRLFMPLSFVALRSKVSHCRFSARIHTPEVCRFRQSPSHTFKQSPFHRRICPKSVIEASSHAQSRLVTYCAPFLSILSLHHHSPRAIIEV